MTKRMLIDAHHPEETRVVIADENQIYDFDFVSSAKKQVKGNIYLAKVTRVEPSLQAAFVEYGGGKQGFLPFAEIHADYYQIPAADRKRLLEEAAREESEFDDKPEAPISDFSSPTDAETELSNQSDGEFALPALREIAPVPDMPETAESETIESIAQPLSSEPEPFLSEPFPEAALSGNADPIVEVIEPAGYTTEHHTEATSADAASEEVETIPNDDEAVSETRKRRSFSKRYKIQEVIRRGQVVLVQVIKEERGNKGASLTTYLSLAGRYCVLMPNSPKDGGISRKIANAEDRKRLKAISTELRLAEGMSVIIRTAGMERPRAEIKRDFDYLVKLWNHIRTVTLESTAPALIYEESDVIKRAIRDQYTNDIDELIIEGEFGFETAKEFMKLLLPSHVARIKHYKEATPLYYAYNVEDQLMSMHDPVVKLKSGGYIVINPTEALISIDVNSGRSTGERNIEETASKTNIEAANEVARQLRLRDLAGLIVIDFIDMLESRNRRAVEKTLKDALKADRAKIQLGRISPFGLLEMSRQRLRPSISETNMVQCPHCVGRGFIRSNESMSIQIIRAIEKEASSGNWGSLRLIATQTIALHLLNHKRDILRAIETQYNVSVQVLIDTELTVSEFNLEKMRRANTERKSKYQDRSRPAETAAIAAEFADQPIADNDDVDPYVSEVSEPSEATGEPRPRNTRGRRGGRGGRNRRDREPNNVQATADAPESSAANEVDGAQDSDNNEAKTDRPDRGDRPRNRGRRGGRGRKPWRERDDRGERPATASENSGDSARVDNVVSFEPQAAPVTSYAPSLPAFTARPAVKPPAPVQPPVIESTPRDPNAPPKKGWWQKMISLD